MSTIAGIPGLTRALLRPRCDGDGARGEAVDGARFSGGSSAGHLAAQRLDDVVRVISGLPFDRTDCALPMLHAAGNNLPIDAFVVYTDNETWAETSTRTKRSGRTVPRADGRPHWRWSDAPRPHSRSQTRAMPGCSM